MDRDEEKLIRMCCVCSAVEDKGIWRYPTEEEANSKDRITHTYCPIHYAKARKEIGLDTETFK